MALYNGGDYLKHSIRSVLNQTHADFEFLIINDCSTDNSLQVIASFNDQRIKVHHNASNIGQTKSLNVGLKLACGEYIARMDADDVAFPFWLEKQLESVQKHPDRSVISTYVTAIDEHNRIKKVYKPASTMEDLILRSFIASPVNHVGSVLRKKDILECGGYDEQYKTAADYDLWGKLLRSGKRMTTTQQFLAAIREHDRSLSRLARGKRELSEIIDIAKKNISAFSSVKVNDTQVEQICQAHYLPESLTIGEFDAAIRITQTIYANLVPFLGVGDDTAAQWSRQQIRAFYVKRIFSLIEQGNYSLVRQTAGRGIKDFGPASIFMLFFMFSFLGQIVLSPLPKIYKAILKRKAHFQLGNKALG